MAIKFKKPSAHATAEAMLSNIEAVSVGVDPSSGPDKTSLTVQHKVGGATMTTIQSSLTAEDVGKAVAQVAALFGHDQKAVEKDLTAKAIAEGIPSEATGKKKLVFDGVDLEPGQTIKVTGSNGLDGVYTVSEHVIAEPKPKKKPGKFLQSKLAETIQKIAAESVVADQMVPDLAIAKPVQELEVQVTDELTAQVEELVDLDSKMRLFNGYEIQKRIDEIKKLLNATASENSDPSLPVTFTCPSGSVVYSEAKHTQEISDKPGLIKAMGVDTFMQVAKVTLTDAKKYLSEIELAKVTTKGFGSRTLKAINKTVK